MKKDMSTFEMAQAAYENPGKDFVGTESSSVITVSWKNRQLLSANGNDIDIVALQRMGYVWNEKVEPRKWCGEYVTERGWRLSGTTPSDTRPTDVKSFLVRWEAEERL